MNICVENIARHPLSPPPPRSESSEQDANDDGAAVDGAVQGWHVLPPPPRSRAAAHPGQEGGSEERRDKANKTDLVTASLPPSLPPSRFLSRNDLTMERNIGPIVEKFSYHKAIRTR